SYFDADELAMKGTSPDGEIMYIDSEGYNYGFNKSENKWQKTGLMKSDAMAFMMPMMSTGIIKMPVGPTMQASEQMKAKGLNANTFQLVEWAFIYRPEHFRNEDYTESTVKCQSGECVKFSSTDSEMSGTYILFDNQNRLSKVHAIVNTPEGKKTGDYNFEYTDVSVNLPPAKEVKMPFQDLFMVGADATPPGENVSGSYDVNDNSSSNDSDGMSHKAINSMTENLKNSDVGKEDLPETYNFDWRYRMKMDMGNKKQEPLDMVFLLKKNANYQGVTVENPETGSISEATMVFDSSINSLVMFIISGQSKFLQIHPMQAPKDTGDISDMKIRELPPKSIIGYNSKGLEIENDKFLIQVYHSVEAPISMSNLFNFSGPMDINVPNIDPKLVEQFSKGLIMELTYTDKKKSKNNAKLTAQSLEQAPTSFDKKNYQNMSFMGQLKSMKNN
ncbi:MAG: hypothetical protein R3213_09820, partial [Flavobacteriaceae bacterium]|nr:hypothetical protein [Flavobacteriaceae bacterium]